MSASSFGQRLVVTTFGESHGKALGAVIDGCPAGIEFDEGLLKTQLERRRPGRPEESGAVVVSARAETDIPEILSGVFEGRTLGTPIAILVRNQDARSDDYREIAKAPRAGHADDVWKDKFGHSDPRGGGRSSGRETVARVMAGSVARMILRSTCPRLRIKGFARQIGPMEFSDFEQLEAMTQAEIDLCSARFPSVEAAPHIEALLTDAQKQGQSYGGTAEFWIDGAPHGLGQPVFHKLKSDLAQAVMSVGATAAIEIGEGMESTRAEGSEFHRRADEGERYGGIRGGISTGERIVIRVGFKPTSSVLDVAKKGRHDPCIVPRAIPVIESMIALVLADHVLWSRSDRV